MEEHIKVSGEGTMYNLAPHIAENDISVDFLRKASRGEIEKETADRFVKTLMHQGIILSVSQNHNLVPTVGRGVLARILAGTTTPSGVINYMAIGTGTTAFTNASLFLNAETFRKVVSSSSFDGNISYIDCFIASGDVANATYKEAGAFIDASTGSATGSAFSLVVQDFVKSGSMYISLKVTFT